MAETANRIWDGKRLEKARDILKISRTDLIIRLDGLGKRASFWTIQNWETGKTSPDASDMPLLAKALEQPITFFYPVSK